MLFYHKNNIRILPHNKLNKQNKVVYRIIEEYFLFIKRNPQNAINSAIKVIKAFCLNICFSSSHSCLFGWSTGPIKDTIIENKRKIKIPYLKRDVEGNISKSNEFGKTITIMMENKIENKVQKIALLKWNPPKYLRKGMKEMIKRINLSVECVSIDKGVIMIRKIKYCLKAYQPYSNTSFSIFT